MRTTRLVSVVLFVFGLAGLAACSNTDTTSPTTTEDEQARTSGIALTSDTLADTDVARMHFSIQGVNCQTGEQTGFAEQQTKDLEDMMLPGGIAQFENAPFDEQGQHLFADAFFLVGAGCYDVTTQPLDEQGNASNDCQPAHRDRVSVEDGQTTEILLINQCRGAQNGGVDIVSGVNHPPELQNVEFQKFLSSCPPEGQQTDATRRVCATAVDPDGDDIEFNWQAVQGGEVVGDIIETTRTRNEDGSWESCADLAITEQGEHQFRVQVFDLDGEGNRLESVLSEQEGQNITSRAGLQFPVYSAVNCPVQEPAPEPRGRNVTMLMALSQAGPGADIPWLIQNSVLWVSPREDAENSNILYIIDDNHQGEFIEDRELVLNQLRNAGIHFQVDDIEEPEGGISADQLEGYDVVWFANPAHRMDDQQTFEALVEFQADDGGLILQGQDMAATTFEEQRSMRELTRLEFVNDGRVACGDQITGTENSYQVTYTDEPHPVLTDLRGRTFPYPSDIDRVNPTLSGEFVLANKAYASGDCQVRAPAVSAIDPELGDDIEEGDLPMDEDDIVDEEMED